MMKFLRYRIGVFILIFIQCITMTVTLFVEAKIALILRRFGSVVFNQLWPQAPAAPKTTTQAINSPGL